jgi:hypothetical protein
MALLPTRPLDLCDGLVGHNDRSGEIAKLRHALGQRGFHMGSALLIAIRPPGGAAPLDPLGDLALPDQCPSSAAGHQGFGHEGQAVFAAAHSIALFDTL